MDRRDTLDDCEDQEALDRVADVRARVAKLLGEEPQHETQPPKA